MGEAATSARPTIVSHNLVGQRLGRKGLETRERILAATTRLLDETDEPITLTGVAREVSVGMTTLYLYFPDIGDLLLAVLSRLLDTSEQIFPDHLLARWPDERLGELCRAFIVAHHSFRQRHARILRMRDAYADAGDLRFMQQRIDMSRPILALVVRQMDCDPERSDHDSTDVALVAMVGFERLASVTTNPGNRHFDAIGLPYYPFDVNKLVVAQAQLLEAAIRDQRLRHAPAGPR